MGLAGVVALLFSVLGFSVQQPEPVGFDAFFLREVGSVPEEDVQTPAVNMLSQQLLQGPVRKLAWHFPQAPQLTKRIAVDFKMQVPGPVSSVAIECNENTVYVEVKEDLFGTGELIDPLALTLGGCAATGEDSAARVLIFESPLQACNSTLSVCGDILL